MSEEEQQSAPAEAPVEEQAPEDAPVPAPSFMQKLRAKPMNMIIIGAVVAIVVIAAVVMGGGGAGGGLFGKKEAPAPMKMTSISGNYALAGPQVQAGQTMEFPIEFNSSQNDSSVMNIYEVNVACSWTDDYAGSEDDSMTFELTSPDGQNISKNTAGSSGSCQLTITDSNITDSKMVDNTKDWVLKVTCVFAGHKDVGPLGFLIYTDAGNTFDAKIDYKYYGHETK